MNERHHNLGRRNPDFTWQSAWLWLFICAQSGCALTVPAPPDDGHAAPITVEHSRAEDIWQALAQAVQSKTIDTTTRLAQYVTILARNGELSEKDVTAFDAAFPRVASESRSLIEHDVETLVRLAQGISH